MSRVAGADRNEFNLPKTGSCRSMSVKYTSDKVVWQKYSCFFGECVFSFIFLITLLSCLPRLECFRLVRIVYSLEIGRPVFPTSGF